MLCSSCGYDNPREHRYCGMCGTPFPQRNFTVPEAQSTLSFGGAPVESASPATQVSLTRPPAPETVEPMPVATPAVPADETAHEALSVVAEAHSVQPAAAAAQIAVIEPQQAATSPAQGVGTEEAAPEKPAAAAEPEAVPVVSQTAGEAAPPPPREVPATVPPAPRVSVKPAPHPRPAPPPPPRLFIPTPAAFHPSPDSLRITPPPASAGMPTFQEVAEAAGAPPISPLDTPEESHSDQDRELQEYIATFSYTPPAETADELTMRSEVPVIEKLAPAPFHHPSFDDDVPPPPEAGPHPKGEEYYKPSGAAKNSRLLDLAVSWHADTADDSTLRAIAAAAGSASTAGKWWLWSSLVALVTIFGGLGFLEGRAQTTHSFRGPIEVVRATYISLRQHLARRLEGGAGSPPGSTPTAQRPPATVPAASNGQSESLPKPNSTEATPESADVIASAPIEAPPPKPAPGPQPGQLEMNKARDASDSTAAAAWLWKATSRGNPEAPVRLADLYLKGSGVPKSCEQALVLLRSAASKENAPARNRLAALYANGTCVARDPVKAYQLMSSALDADPGSDWARENRQQLWEQMTPEQRAQAGQYH